MLQRLLYFLAFVLLATNAVAQQAPGNTIPTYQYMHVGYSAKQIIFAPAFQGKESVKIGEVEGVSQDKDRRALEAISKILGETSAAGWEIVHMVPLQAPSMSGGSAGTIGFTYLLRKRLP